MDEAPQTSVDTLQSVEGKTRREKFSEFLTVQSGLQVPIVLEEYTACTFYHQMTEGGSSAALLLSCKLHGVKIPCVQLVVWRQKEEEEEAKENKKTTKLKIK